MAVYYFLEYTQPPALPANENLCGSSSLFFQPLMHNNRLYGRLPADCVSFKKRIVYLIGEYWDIIIERGLFQNFIMDFLHEGLRSFYY